MLLLLLKHLSVPTNVSEAHSTGLREEKSSLCISKCALPPLYLLLIWVLLSIGVCQKRGFSNPPFFLFSIPALSGRGTFSRSDKFMSLARVRLSASAKPIAANYLLFNPRWLPEGDRKKQRTDRAGQNKDISNAFHVNKS